jgi:MFS family permease
VQSGWAVGWGGAVLLYVLLSSQLSPTIAWRVMFALGLLPALLILYVQRSIEEPARLAPVATMFAGSAWRKPFEIFTRSTLRMTLICSLLGIGAHGGYYAVSTWLPTYLRSNRHLTVLGTGAYLAVIIVAFWCGCIACSSLLDRIGRRRTILLFAVCCVATVACYLFLPITNHQMLALGFPLGFFSAGIPSSMGALFSELFPRGIRGTGVGFCYNFGRVVSAVLPTFVGKLSDTIGLRSAIGFYAVGAYSIVVIATLMLPETTGKELT